MHVVMSISLSYQPRAECIANVAAEGEPERRCTFRHPPSQATMAAVKDHVRRTGHTVQVVRETVSEYDRAE